MKFSRSNGAPYAALDGNGRRLASMRPGGLWVVEDPDQPMSAGEWLYILAPAYGSWPIAPVGPRMRPSALAERMLPC